MMAGAVVGRDREYAVIRAFLDDEVPEPSVLLLEGDPGIGKTTLWRAAVAAAERSGHKVLSCAPDGSEAAISLAALADLLEPMADGGFDGLPEPQRNALEIALLRREGPAPSQLEVGRSVLSVFRSSTSEGLVVAVDDIQWLDGATAAILNFALRRIAQGRLRFLVARRTGGSDPFTLERLYAIERTHRIEIGPLGVDDLAKVVRAKLGLNLPRPVLVRLAEASGGNPFFALEIARNVGGHEGGGELTIPLNLREAVHGRLERLSDQALEVALVAAALSRPMVATLARAIGDPVRCDEALAEAEKADVLGAEGPRVYFTHPLLGSTIYAGATPTNRRLLHRKLADFVDDAEERARHLALSADGPDEEIAAALEDAAGKAVSRGAPAGAAQLLERAAALTPLDHENERRRRTLDAARRHFDSGNAGRATEMLEAAAASFPAGPERAKALKLLASVRRSTDGVEAAMQTFFQALNEAEGDPAQQAAIEEQIAWMQCWTGSVPGTYEHAIEALKLMEGVDDEVLLMAVLTAVAEAEFHLGMESTHATMERALEIERRHPNAVSVIDSPTAVRATHLWRMEALEESTDFIDRCVEMAAIKGDEGSKAWIFLARCSVEFVRGDATAAMAWCDAAREFALQTGQDANDATVTAYRGWALTFMGRTEEARLLLTEALTVAEQQHVHQWTAIRSRWLLGLCDLYDGDYQGARAYMERAHASMLNTGTGEPNSFNTLIPDYAEVMVALGEHAAALEAIEPYEAAGIRLGRKRVVGNSARVRGLIAAAEGRVEEADAFLGRAVDELEKSPARHELGRALLSLGSHHRRTKRKKLAREALEHAVVVFERVAAEGWAERARGELARIGGRTPGPIELTDTESQVAKLVAEGLTNKEVAERLYISVRTVETNLSKVYRKLQIRSRTELANRLAGR
jgi:DNA-binding CsgD family transcriptional regulator